MTLIILWWVQVPGFHFESYSGLVLHSNTMSVGCNASSSFWPNICKVSGVNKTREPTNSWWNHSVRGLGKCTTFDSFPQRRVRLSPANTKTCVLDQGSIHYWGTERETQREVGGGGKTGRRVAKSSARKEPMPALIQVSISDPSILPLIIFLHPVPPYPSQQLAGYQPGRERPLWWHRLRRQCSDPEQSLSKLCMNPHPLPSPSLTSSSLSNPALCGLLITHLFTPPMSPQSYFFSFPFLFLIHQSFLSSTLFLIPAVTPGPTLHGPAFQSTFNWLGVTYSQGNGSTPPGEVGVYGCGATLPSALQSTVVDWRIWMDVSLL